MLADLVAAMELVALKVLDQARCNAEVRRRPRPRSRSRRVWSMVVGRASREGAKRDSRERVPDRLLAPLYTPKTA